MLKQYSLKPKLLLVTNPNKGWLYNEYYKPYIDGTLPDYRKLVLGLPQDNLSLDQSYIDNLELVLSAPERERLLRGNWDYADEDYSLFTYDNILQMFYNRVDSGEKFISCDVANIGNDKTVIGVWNGLDCFNIYVYEKYDTTKVVNIIKEKMKTYGVKIKNVVIDADGLGIGVADYLKGCVPFKGGSSPLNKENYRNLRSQCYFKMSDIIGNIKIVDNKYKEYIIQDLQAHKINDPDADGKTSIISKDKIKEAIGRSPDFSDMLMMRMYHEIKRVRHKTMVY